MKKILEPENALYPLPVVMVSCQHEGVKNIITVAWTGTCSSKPPTVGIGIRPERFSHALIRDSGEFVVNIPSKKLYLATDFCGIKSGKEVDKFSELGLTFERGTKTNAPLIKEAPVNLECRVIKTVNLGSHDYFIGEVEQVHIDEEHLDDQGRLNPQELLTYGGKKYFELGKVLGEVGVSLREKGGKQI